MAYVNVAEWTSQHVGDWLYGKQSKRKKKKKYSLILFPSSLIFINSLGENSGNFNSSI